MGFPTIIFDIWSFLIRTIKFVFGFETMEQLESDFPSGNIPLSGNVHVQRMQSMHKDQLKYVEKELSFREIVSLSFLLLGDDIHNRAYVLQQLGLLLRSSSREWNILHLVAETRQDWKAAMLEALSVIRAHKVIRKWGFNAQELREMYLPHIPETSTNINIVLKALYHLAEKMDLSNAAKLIDFMKTDDELVEMFITREPMFLELSYMEWISLSLIKVDRNSQANLDLIVQFLKENDMINLKDMIIQCVNIFNDEVKKSIPYIPRNITTDQSNVRGESSSSMLSRSIGIQETSTGNSYPKYNVNKDSAGFVLIINQVEFTRDERENLKHLLPSKMLETRHGSDVDKKALEETFTSHGYKPIVIENKDHEFVRKTIQEVVHRSVAYDSLIICYLSHGSDGLVYAANSIPIQIQAIKRMMVAENALLGKPKMLIIQACQGDEIQIAKHSDLEHDGPSTAAPLADMLTYLSTVAGFASFRHRSTGSWFIQTLCEHIKGHGNTEPMEEIIRMVTDEVTQKRGNNGECMVPEKSSTLVRKFYLPKRD